MKKMLLLLCVLVAHKISFAQYQTPTVDGTIGGSEYANSYTSGSGNYYITWNATTLFVAVNFGNATNDAINLYIDHNPIAVVNGGTNSNGTLSGTNYDQTTPNLPFRADFRAFVKNAYDDYVTANGSGGWNSSVAGGITKAISGSVIEFSIPWSSVTGSGIPSSFNFLLYRSYDAGSNTGTFSTAPTANPALSNCTSSCTRTVTQPYYFTVSTTGNGSSTAAFSRISYATNSGSATLSSATDYFDFTLNSSSTTLSSGAHNVSGTLTVTNGGSLTTGGLLTLKSTASNTARVAAVSGTISGNVTCEKYIAGGGLSTASPSKRAFRFLAHPFNAGINLSQLTGTGEIDITGTGGASNGFTATSTNNPSAFKYDAASATSNTGAGLQNGWVAYTSANGGAGNTWNQYKGLRVFYRGAKGEGLAGSTYTVGNATLVMTGALNTGNQTINLDYNSGASTGFNLVSNPYASNVDMTSVTGGRLVNVASSYYVWNLALGNRGAYSTQTFGSAYVLPAYASFFVSATAGGGSITFNESDKTATAATQSLLRTTAANKLRLQLKSGNILWDEFELEFGSKYKAATEYEDAAKLANPDVSFYSVSASNDMLAIDRRSVLKDGESVALGLDAAEARSYTLEVSDNTIANQELYLVDKYTNQTQKLEVGAIYSFSTDANPASQGVGRFTIVAKNILPSLTLTNGFTVTVGPNPTNRGVVTVSFTNEEALETSIKITDVQGKTVQVINAGKVSIGNVKINTAKLQAGSYFITLSNGKQTKTQQLLIQ
jgi:hypothetical protein